MVRAPPPQSPAQRVTVHQHAIPVGRLHDSRAAQAAATAGGRGGEEQPAARSPAGRAKGLLRQPSEAAAGSESQELITTAPMPGFSWGPDQLLLPGPVGAVAGAYGGAPTPCSSPARPLPSLPHLRSPEQPAAKRQALAGSASHATGLAGGGGAGHAALEVSTPLPGMLGGGYGSVLPSFALLQHMQSQQVATGAAPAGALGSHYFLPPLAPTSGAAPLPRSAP